MNIEDLKTFIVLANTKNFTRASSQLFVAQSTVTNRISELEKELNAHLFSRSNRSVELTIEGERFLEYAEKMLNLTNSALAGIADSKHYEHHIRIGAADSIYDGHLSNLILKHMDAHPADSLRITIGLSSHLLEQLQENIFDIVFSYLPLNKSDYKCEVFAKDPMTLVTDYNNRKYTKGITAKELIKENYIMCNFALQDVGQFIRSLFPKYHTFSLEIDDCSKIIPFLIGRESYTFLPEDMAAPYIKEKRLRRIPLLDLNTPVINCYIIGKKSKIAFWKEQF